MQGNENDRSGLNLHKKPFGTHKKKRKTVIMNIDFLLLYFTKSYWFFYGYTIFTLFLCKRVGQTDGCFYNIVFNN